MPKHSPITSLAFQIKDHLKTTTYTLAQLQAMTGAHYYQVVDAITWLLGEGYIAQDVTPRYRLLKSGSLVTPLRQPVSLPPGADSRCHQ